MEERERQEGESERQAGESERQGVRKDQASREQSFVEGGLKITGSFVKQSEKGRRNHVSEHCSEHTLIIIMAGCAVYCCMKHGGKKSHSFKGLVHGSWYHLPQLYIIMQPVLDMFA